MDIATPSPLASAFGFYRHFYWLFGALLAVIAAQSLYLGVPLSDFSEIGIMLFLSFAKFLLFMLLLAFVLLVRSAGRGGGAYFKSTASAYMESPRFAYGICGALVMIVISVLFIIEKCFIPFFVPFQWDPAFAEADRMLHFGHYPQDYLIPLVENHPAIAGVFQAAYGGWLFALYLTVAYSLYCDGNLMRRMQLMWASTLSFLVLGCILAMAFSSVGPIFFHDFYPDIANPYAGLLAHLERMSQQMPLSFFSERHWLIGWTRDADFVNLNSISAMPSVHNGSMLFLCLYMRQISRAAFYLMCAMLVLVLLATVYSGLHYAIDAYVAYVIVGMIWWLSGGLVRRLYPGIGARELANQ